MQECDSGQLGKRCNYSTGPFVAISKLWAITSVSRMLLKCLLDEVGMVANICLVNLIWYQRFF